MRTTSRAYLNISVFDAALDRVRYIFDEFEEVIVTISGGKDSTVVLNLALQVAEEKGRLPLKVAFIDQEAEWTIVIEYLREVFSDPRIEPWWFQMPIRIFNAMSPQDPWLTCWGEGQEWLREREPGAITENVYETDRFKELFSAIAAYHWPHKRLAQLSGVRCEESPGRTKGLTGRCTYKHIPWGDNIGRLGFSRTSWGKASGVKAGRPHYTFYPIYDWTYRDVWKSIHDNDWPYCGIYDLMYQRGVDVRNMRVSNLHHETAIKSLFILQEVDGELWDKLNRRIGGINTARHISYSDAFAAKQLPPMFKDWVEYRDYLLENLITDPDQKRDFKRLHERYDDHYGGIADRDKLTRVQVAALLVNDYHGTKLLNFKSQPQAIGYRAWVNGKNLDRMNLKWVPGYNREANTVPPYRKPGDDNG